MYLTTMYMLSQFLVANNGIPQSLKECRCSPKLQQLLNLDFLLNSLVTFLPILNNKSVNLVSSMDFRKCVCVHVPVLGAYYTLAQWHNGVMGLTSLVA